MNERNVYLIGIGAALAVGAGLYLARGYFAEEPLEQQAPPVEPAPPPAEDTVQHPVPPPEAAEPAAEPLPSLAESDPSLQSALSVVLGQEAVAKYLVPDGIVRRFVASIDNLPRKKVALQVRPVAGAPGTFMAAGTEEELTLNEENFARYDAYVQLIGAADPKQLAQVYLRFYPLMQESYEGLGYPNRYFNDRMVEVIDHLIATPDVTGPIRLTQPHVFYEFADPRLEGLSAGQKTLIRMGSANAAVVKKKLAAVRREITQKKE